jgi:hypothetical protein
MRRIEKFISIIHAADRGNHLNYPRGGLFLGRTKRLVSIIHRTDRDIYLHYPTIITR